MMKKKGLKRLFATILTVALAVGTAFTGGNKLTAHAEPTGRSPLADLKEIL